MVMNGNCYYKSIVKSYLVGQRETWWHPFFATKDKKNVPQTGSESRGILHEKDENGHSGFGFSYDKLLLSGQRTGQST